MSGAGLRTVGARAPRRRSALDPHSGTFAAFADVLYAGVLVFALSLPVVTGFAAFGAGVAALREARENDGHVTIGSVWRAFVRRLRRPVTQLLLPAVVTALLALDLLVLPFLGADPTLAAAVPIVLASVAGAVALRVAGAWRDDASATRILGIAWRRMSDDAAGTVVLVLAVASAGAVIAVVPLLIVVMAGPLALAALAMDRDGAVSR
ncbi:hypothetical protein EDF36_1108 [Rathayibacter sp. PhB152]|uniref:hypothetical protein n=1 Tax=Rathayibacter sp. PhB152 TaxID=2485190 RepID=UPI000FBAD46A|nr:hypothetical protein [Rathayibacter sp. PhB152]ROQ64153.1 hypothetical protein EDF36_1108 [Rathayibacter sp. PhB152]